MSSEVTKVSADLAQQALDNLVNQFARPLDFLRELVQNAIDAGTPRVEVWFRFRPGSGGSGVLEIHVDDFGEGMDETIIDGELTRMFASSKEGDLTKIGKFGIGFTSIFAIRPQAIRLRTGRHNEHWELVFHPDRSFDKFRIDAPVYGTKITLFKELEPREVDEFVRRCRWSLSYWLEHSDVPILFAPADLSWDGVDAGGEDAAPAPADPFAAFAGPAGAQPGIAGVPGRGGFSQINAPLTLDAPLRIEVDEGDVQGFVGYTDAPLHAFYNGGLTLVRSASGEALAGYRSELGHLGFKVKGRHLEHTLTRDNVLQDDAWHDAMRTLVKYAWLLRPKLLARIAEETRPGGDPDPWLRHLARECRHAKLHRHLDGVRDALVLPRFDGTPVSLADVLAQDRELGYVLVAGAHDALNEALAADGIILLADRPAVREAVTATWDPHWIKQAVAAGLASFGIEGVIRRHQPILSADAIFALPQLLEDRALPPDEAALVGAARDLLEAVHQDVGLRFGEFGGLGVEKELALEGPPEGGVFHRRRPAGWFSFDKDPECLLVNRHHEVVRAQAAVASREPSVAAFGLLSAILGPDEDLAPLLPALRDAAFARSRA